MFWQIAAQLGRPTDVFELHPNQLAALMELAWSRRFRPHRRPSLPLPDDELNSWVSEVFPPTETDLSRAEGDSSGPSGVEWHHLIYAYMIDNTRILEIFRRVVYEFLHGERLNVPSVNGQRWLRNTEQLFFNSFAFPFLVFPPVSHVRPDVQATARNAYFRMFGMDLNHGTVDGRPYPYVKPEASNVDFVPTFERLLQEVHRAIINSRNTSGPNTTDEAAMFDLTGQLRDMLVSRRRHGNLSQEEFYLVAQADWFHLTVALESPIVTDLQAWSGTSNPAETLRMIGERVGVRSHGKSHDFFSLAERMSRFLILVEADAFNDISNVPLLYHPSSPISEDMMNIVSLWSDATGRDLKAEPVTMTRPSRPIARTMSPAPVRRQPAGRLTSTVSPNGRSQLSPLPWG